MYLYTRHLNLYIMIYHSTLLTCALYDLLYHHKEKLHVNLPIPVRRRDDLTSHVSHMLATRRNRAKRTRMPNPGTPEAQKAPISTSTLHVSPQATPTILLPSRHATMPPKSTPPARKSAPPASPVKNAYLLAYNALSAALWAGVLYKTVLVATREVNAASKNGWIKNGEGPLGALQKGLSSGAVYDELEVYTRLTQSLAGLEVVHSLFGTYPSLQYSLPFLFTNWEMGIRPVGESQYGVLMCDAGIVRSPLLTTLMQVSSRFLLVHLIAQPFPSTTRTSPAYTTMLLAWSVTEVIRYSYFVFTLSGVGVPALWQWLRYNTFLVLYPMGVSSECWLVWKASQVVGDWAGVKGEYWRYAMWAVLAVYVPGIWVLFTHMLKQRGRVMRESKRKV
jgi:very-long-chain (3R)-3-hydroxyacyl-CoA dehydratase